MKREGKKFWYKPTHR